VVFPSYRIFVLHKMRTFFLITVLSVLALTSNAAVCTATANGAWNNASTWSCPGGPGCGDVVVIPAGKTVTITAQQDYSPCTALGPLQIFIYGCLKFDNGNKLKLPCNSNLYIASSGSMVPGTGGGNSNYLEICTTIQWNAADGTSTGPIAYCSLPPCSLLPLPVELVAFTAREKNKKIYLDWKTETESNNHHYEVEKSFDGINFVQMASVNSKAPNGSSRSPLEYQAVDSDVLHSLCYYRLKQIDKDGAARFSNVISVKISSIELNIYPNPNSGSFNIDLPNTAPNSNLEIVIFNSLGQEVYRSSQSQGSGEAKTIQIAPNLAFPKGIYTTSVSVDGETHMLKLLVQ
jgi:hypothetical protein